MGWMDLTAGHRMFLIRLEPDIWAEIVHGALVSMDLLRPGEKERRPEFRPGDVLLLYHPQSNSPDAPQAELSHVVALRSERSNDTGYDLGPVYRMTPALPRERILAASQRGILPEGFRRADDRTFVFSRLTSDERDQFVEFVLNAGICLSIEEGKGGRPAAEPAGETPGIVEYEW